MGKHSGSHSWLVERGTAIAIVPCALVLLYKVGSIMRSGTFSDFFSSPFSLVFMMLFFLFSAYHSHLGLKVVAEDYVSCPIKRSVISGMMGFVTLITCAFLTFAGLYGYISPGG